MLPAGQFAAFHAGSRSSESLGSRSDQSTFPVSSVKERLALVTVAPAARRLTSWVCRIPAAAAKVWLAPKSVTRSSMAYCVGWSGETGPKV
jgi:hypothetical protein